MSDPYAVLGVDKTATDEQIKQAFRKLAMQHHPDQNAGDASAEARFKEINAAYNTLKNPQTRADHDHQQQKHGNPFEFHFRSGPGVNIDDIMRDFANRQAKPHNRSFNTHCMIDFQNAFDGCEVNLTMQDGRDIRLKVPAGVDNGTRIRVAGGGENVHPDSPPGDLFVMISVQPHPIFHRNGKTLYINVPIDTLDAILGTKLSVPTMDGDELEINTGPTVQNDQKINVSGRGMPIVGSDKRGDMIVNLSLVTPQLNDKQKELLEQIKSLSN